jgi:hypothetical protein
MHIFARRWARLGSGRARFATGCLDSAIRRPADPIALKPSIEPKRQLNRDCHLLQVGNFGTCRGQAAQTHAAMPANFAAEAAFR